MPWGKASRATLVPSARIASIPVARFAENRTSPRGVSKPYMVPSSSMSKTSHAPTTTRATSLPDAASAQSFCQPSQGEKSFSKLTELLTDPESCTLHPSTLPLTT